MDSLPARWITGREPLLRHPKQRGSIQAPRLLPRLELIDDIVDRLQQSDRRGIVVWRPAGAFVLTSNRSGHAHT